MNSLIEQLHDIEGLDPISWWPLAAGWWILIGTGLLLAIIISWYFAYRIAFKRSWKNDTLQKLAFLENNLSEKNARDTLITLSEFLRRIALHRFSRNECAGLTGEAWLRWLAENDPLKYEWVNKGTLLVEIPYSPSKIKLPTNEIKELIQAVKNWVIYTDRDSRIRFFTRKKTRV